MTPEQIENLAHISEQIKSIDQKLDLIVKPIQDDVYDIKKKIDSHSGRIQTLESFKEGHQMEHREGIDRRRFNWEIIIGSGIIGAVIKWVGI